MNKPNDKREFHILGTDDTNAFDIETAPSTNIASELGRESKLIRYRRVLLKIIPTLLATGLYLTTLRGCEKKDDDACFRTFNEVVVRGLIKVCICSGLIYGIMIFLSLIGKLGKKHLFINLSIILFLTLIYDTGTNLASHGGYNRLLLYIIIIAVVVVLSIIYGLVRLIKRIPWITIISLLALAAIGYYKWSNIASVSCDLWDKGFKNTTIDNSLPCKILKPRVCLQVITDNWFDVSRLLGTNCQNFGNTKKETLFQYLKLGENVTRVGYPRTESWNWANKSDNDAFQMNVINEIVDMDDPNLDPEAWKSIEFTVDFKASPPKADLNLKKNNTLIDERREIRKGGHNLIFKNVFILFIDSLSRSHMKRKLPRVYKWLEQYYNPDETSKYEAFQFLKYHSVGAWTNPNMVPAFFGVPYYFNNNTVLNNGKPSYIKHFKEKGYITGNTVNVCSRDIAAVNELNNNLDYHSYDHELTSPFCDPNFQDPIVFYTFFTGPYGLLHKCLYNQQTVHWSLDYAKQFLTTYKNEPKVFRAVIDDSHEGSGENIKYTEDELLSFLNFYVDNGHLEDSVFILLSDHGYAMPGPHTMYGSPDWAKEITLPVLNMLLPRSLKDFQKIRNNLKGYENLFVTPYDFHKSLMSVLDDYRIPVGRYGNSLFFSKPEDSMGYRQCGKIFPERIDLCRCSDEEGSGDFY
jgi:hypothetical protein